MEGKSDKPVKKDTSGRPRIATLGSLNQQQQQQSSSDDEGQAFYVGGSEKSGQQVLGPNKEKADPNEVIKNVFKAAREQGAQPIEPESPEQARKFAAFKGKGKKLGDDEEGQDEAAGGESSPEIDLKPITMVLKMWRNGFSVDDGPLRAFQDPQNREFLESITRGEVPRELLRMARGGQVNLNMEDHRNEEYVQVKRRVKAFAGEGHRLGNVTPETIGASGSNSQASGDNKANEEEAKKRLKIDESKPTTNIQVRLSDGSRIVIKVNLDHTVQDIRSYICDARPVYGPLPFILMTNFPTKQLTDETQTVSEANLQNATLTQKLV